MTSAPIAGLILAGGLARRMGGGDKGLKSLGGKPVLDRVVAAARRQCDPLVLNAGGDPARFQAYDLPVLADVLEGAQGPLAGVLTGLEWLRTKRPDISWLATFTTDAPFIPPDLVVRLATAVADGGQLAVATSGGRSHPVFGLWSVELTNDLRRAMVDEDMRKIDRWTARYDLRSVDFPCDPVDPFFNINRPEDLEEAEALLAKSVV